MVIRSVSSKGGLGRGASSAGAPVGSNRIVYPVSQGDESDRWLFMGSIHLKDGFEIRMGLILARQIAEELRLPEG